MFSYALQTSKQNKETVYLKRYSPTYWPTQSPLVLLKSPAFTYTQLSVGNSLLSATTNLMVTLSLTFPTYLISVLHCLSEKLMALGWTGAGWEAACSPTRSVGEVSTARIFLALSAEAFWLRILKSMLTTKKNKKQRKRKRKTGKTFIKSKSSGYTKSYSTKPASNVLET